jgi:hypothetical protein
MDNQKYLESIGATGEDVMPTCLDAMAKYGDNHWWEELESDPRKFAYYQLKEGVLLTNDFSSFHGAVEQLLGRPVFTHEFSSSNSPQLIEEAEKAYHG